MKKFFTVFLLLITLVLFSVVSFAEVPNDTTAPQNTSPIAYGVGQVAEGIENVGDTIRNAFTKAFDNFKNMQYEGQATSAVQEENGWYIQQFADNHNRTAAIYVDADGNSYTVGYPIYSQLESLGGTAALGYPTSDTYSVSGSYYQNFSNGYVRVADENGAAMFIPQSQVDENGVVSGLQNQGAVNGDTQTPSTTDPVTSGDNPVPNQGTADPGVNLTGDPNASGTANGISGTTPNIDNDMTNPTTADTAANDAARIAVAIALVVIAAIVIVVAVASSGSRRKN